MFGEGECLWLRMLLTYKTTNIVKSDFSMECEPTFHETVAKKGQK